MDSIAAARTSDSVIKFIYTELFDDVIDTYNGINPAPSQCITILDIPGFGMSTGQLKPFCLYFLTSIYIFLECFQQNSFEQMRINFINEKFRQFSTTRLIKEEIEWYKIEGLEIPVIDFLDNQNVIGMKKLKI